MRLAGYKTFDTQWIYFMAKENIACFLYPMIHMNHFSLGEKIPVVETAERLKQNPYSEEVLRLHCP